MASLKNFSEPAGIFIFPATTAGGTRTAFTDFRLKKIGLRADHRAAAKSYDGETGLDDSIFVEAMAVPSDDSGGNMLIGSGGDPEHLSTMPPKDASPPTSMKLGIPEPIIPQQKTAIAGLESSCSSKNSPCPHHGHVLHTEAPFGDSHSANTWKKLKKTRLGRFQRLRWHADGGRRNGAPGLPVAGRALALKTCRRRRRGGHAESPRRRDVGKI